LSFIVFEGGEGGGKSTQARILYGRLCQKRHRARLLHEPGDTALGEALRRLVTGPRQTLFSGWRRSLTQPLDGSQLVAQDIWLPITPVAELLLFAAARAQLVEEQIKPLLQRNLVVVCDRFAYSTVAYQGYGHGLDLGFISSLNALVTQGVKPDLVVLLDIEPTKGLTRKRGTAEMSKFEVLEADFHRRVRDGYLTQANADPEHWLVVDAGLPRQKVTQLIWQRVEKLLG